MLTISLKKNRLHLTDDFLGEWNCEKPRNVFLQLCGYRAFIKISLSNHYAVLLALSFLMQSSSVRVSHERGSRRYVMHSTFLIGRDAIYRMYCEVNKY